MPSALVIQHVGFEDLGNLGPALQSRGYTAEFIAAGYDAIPDSSAADLLIVLGGPIGVSDIRDYPFLEAEIALLAQRLNDKLPCLGICLGAQLMAAALGARVFAGPHTEIGWSELDLSDDALSSPLRHLRNVPVLHWHGDTFDLPDGATHLASTSHYRHQAFAIGRHALALQFHPEVSAQGLERWYIGHAYEIAKTEGVSVQSLRRDAQRFAPALGEAAASLWDAWLSALELD